MPPSPALTRARRTAARRSETHHPLTLFCPVVLFPQTFPKKEAALAAGLSEKVVAKAFKEGGKKGVEIEGASDMGG